MKIFLLRFCQIVNVFYQFSWSLKYFQIELVSRLLKTVHRKQNFCFQEIQNNVNFFFSVSSFVEIFSSWIGFKIVENRASKAKFFFSFQFRWNIFKLNWFQDCWKTCIESKIFVFKWFKTTSIFFYQFSVSFRLGCLKTSILS